MPKSKTISATAISFVVLFGFLLTTTNVFARSAKPLVEPPKGSWGCALAEQQVKKGITTGMISLNWVPDYRTDEQVFGELVVRSKHTLRIRVEYGNSDIQIHYVSSDNLKYKRTDGNEYIHPNANVWMSDLNNSILRILSAECK